MRILPLMKELLAPRRFDQNCELPDAVVTDRRRKKRTSNKDWANPSDPDAKITKMKDGRTHLAHKAEHVDLD